MKRWFNTKEEALQAARDGGWRLWKVQKLRRKRKGLRWGDTFVLSGDPRWYIGLTPTKIMTNTSMTIEELPTSEWDP